MTEHRWPPQPGDLVKVERSTYCPCRPSKAMIGKVCKFKEKNGEVCFVFTPDHADYWIFNLSDLSPATPPETIERWGRTYRLGDGGRTDAERLDALEQGGWSLRKHGDAWHIASNTLSMKTRISVPYPSVRAAIDAAMSATTEPTP